MPNTEKLATELIPYRATRDHVVNNVKGAVKNMCAQLARSNAAQTEKMLHGTCAVPAYAALLSRVAKS